MNSLWDDDVTLPRDGRGVTGGAGSSGAGRPRRTVLLVEDDDAARDMYGGLLWYNGYDVHHAGDGRTAIDLALALDPDVILLDLGLPGDLDGVAVCERLRERGLAAPIVALTARSRDELGVTPESIGFVDYIEKPIEPYAVVRQVQRLIGYAQPDGIR